MTLIKRRRHFIPLLILAFLVLTFTVILLLYNRLQNSAVFNTDDESHDKKKLGIIVPFRDRFDELMMFVPHLHEYLTRKRVRHHIYVLNQADNYRFNRAALINAGYKEARSEGCSYIAMHDVDLLPLNDDLPYTYPEKGPMHIAAPNLHPLYHYEKYIGGILLISNDHFEQVDGMTNIFWGWGREDDEFYVRLKQAQIELYRPEGITTGYNTFRHIHDRRRRKRDYGFYFNQKDLTKRRDFLTGLHNVQYELINRRHLTIDGAGVSILNVRLHCDLNFTPYCQYPTEKPRIKTKKIS